MLAVLALALAITGCARSTSAPAPSYRLWSTEALADLKQIAQTAPREGLPSEQPALAELTRFERLASLVLPAPVAIAISIVTPV